MAGQVDRERKVEEAEHLLADLWAELQVMESDVDRTILAEVLASDIRLQPAAMEKVRWGRRGALPAWSPILRPSCLSAGHLWVGFLVPKDLT